MDDIILNVSVCMKKSISVKWVDPFHTSYDFYCPSFVCLDSLYTNYMDPDQTASLYMLLGDATVGELDIQHSNPNIAFGIFGCYHYDIIV